MKYLIAILILFVASNAFAGGRINPFNGKPITYSLSESVARDAMGAGAYDQMRMREWQLNQDSMQGYYGGRPAYEFAGGNFGMDIKVTAYNAYGATEAWTIGAFNDTEVWLDGAWDTAADGVVYGAEKGWRQSMTAVWRLGHSKKWGW